MKDLIKEWKKYEYPSESIIRITKKLFNKDSQILDFGCGSGRHFYYLLKNFNAYACDKHNELVNLIRSRIESKDKFRVRVNKLYELPFETNFFDGIILCGVLEYFSLESREFLFEEIKRCLKPNSYVISTLTDKSTKVHFKHNYLSFTKREVIDIFSKLLKNMQIGYEDFEYDNIKLKRWCVTGRIK